ncbi:hypothetical protein B0H11DRAFT_666686 [Mycena galericulata]|nr:hypothetical protein B0H11DRAFT_666686 [Mycena galericulata]
MSRSRGMKEREEKPKDRDKSGAKLWAVDISEAEKYDKALVESWRSDIDGLLVFAGLFSASLTAFLTESYQTLTPDHGDRTIAILTQISLQLSASANGSLVELPTASAVFAPSAASLVCNAFWFLSLGLSLFCALIATLVEQWARDFIQKTDMRPSPIIRGRIYAYLYYGLRRFNMHAFVEIIPVLLHASLILFFAGLVAFLQPVNAVMAALAAALLLVITALTILPIFYSDCPYRTPLSGLVRYTYLRLSVLQFSCVRRSRELDNESGSSVYTATDTPTLVEVMMNEATRSSSDRDSRDCRALICTMKSLTDDDELEPFVEAIPDALGSGKGRAHLYHEQIGAIICHAHSDVRLIPRIQNLLRGCENGLLPDALRQRRQIACLKAIWPIAFSDINSSEPLCELTLDNFSLGCSDPNVQPYFVSTRALSQAKLVYWQKLVYEQNLSDRGQILSTSTPQTSIQIIVQYLVEASYMEVSPYQLLPTCEAVTRNFTPISQKVLSDIQFGLAEIMDARIDHLKSHPTAHHIDRVVQILLSLYQRSENAESAGPSFIGSLLKYIRSRDEDSSLLIGLGGCNHWSLSSSITSFLRRNSLCPEQDFKSLWRICAFYADQGLDPSNSESIRPSGFNEWTVIAVRERAPP